MFSHSLYLANLSRNIYTTSNAGFSHEVLRMYDIEKCSTVLKKRLARRVYIHSHNKMAALEDVYTLKKQTFRSPSRGHS